MNHRPHLNSISPALFGLVIICFFLPFTTVSCQNINFVTLSGFQLATGTQIEQTSGLLSSAVTNNQLLAQAASRKSQRKTAKQTPNQKPKSLPPKTSLTPKERQQIAQAEKFYKQAQAYRLQPNPISALLLGVACGGVAMIGVTIRQKALVEAILAGVGLLLLFCLKVMVDRQTSKAGFGIFRADYTTGYWTTLWLLVGNAGWNGYRCWRDMTDSG
ncbi:hypothetical protein IQ266_16405 [filamentous cyanobacterium LEGE 11480]|uniref:Uncharacterized protein n=1 Tax=Romeriopsis navalis LEGE 11480 TaxID=2777977 RepID=A0A928VMG8_9CYAN|nr:hypothetical protein [Romeriopsis navalis]MBE9031318.1 hypothetical protein [Romeriopsis navalis LEGE 11480]